LISRPYPTVTSRTEKRPGNDETKEENEEDVEVAEFASGGRLISDNEAGDPQQRKNMLCATCVPSI
jgi:hypothetical protein